MSTAPTEPPSRLFTREAVAWIWHDLGTTAFNSVVITFVFSVYLVSPAFGPKDANNEALGTGLSIAALCVALLAPVLGHRADRRGRPVFWLGVNSTVVLVLILSLWFIRPEPQYLWPGIIVLAVATVFSEFAGVNYNALLKRVSTPETVGKISAFAWGSGYLGSIALLLIILFAFIQPEVGLFGVSATDGLSIRASMLLTALWYLVGMVPVLIVLGRGPWPRRTVVSPVEMITVSTAEQTLLPAADAIASHRPLGKAKESILGSYAALWRTLRSLAQESPHTLYFLVASAIFRDGLVGVFAFGGAIAAGTFGFAPDAVVIFAIAANLVAGVATFAMGVLDDKIGPKRVIIGSLICMICAGVGVFILHDGGPVVFWVLGLILCIFVGPAQSSSRTLLTRLIPHGREGEIFGLYATTGRALSFMAPAAFTWAIVLGRKITPDAPSTQYWGILGIVVVLLVGLLVLIPVKVQPHSTVDEHWQGSAH
ncbi:hypothetical protein KEM60_02747 [Austwickia sp. TVS 96-490-7B]|uniref:MFS transporter n=1 Tax=Austwickia sp. TVS 96-490-7B TaxID=2830843 RepID=UPI001C571DB3|nr:MFS transporter [Austwickia sp. TVS 96-490-7B]MBW3086524.1 hypothetical protein [Austwickia sp. TVS 96-490-7B]